MKHAKAILAIAALATGFGFSAMAQQAPQDGGDWKERVKAEKTAFLTQELKLTEAEASEFWGVYETVELSRNVARQRSIEAYMALQNAVESNTGVESALDAYLKAQKDMSTLEQTATELFKKVLPTEKVAKLYISEEKFRRNMIRGFRGHHGDGRPEMRGEGNGERRGEWHGEGRGEGRGPRGGGRRPNPTRE